MFLTYVMAAGGIHRPRISVLVSTNQNSAMAGFTIAFVMFAEYTF